MVKIYRFLCVPQVLLTVVPRNRTRTAARNESCPNTCASSASYRALFHEALIVLLLLLLLAMMMTTAVLRLLVCRRGRSVGTDETT